MPSTKKSVGTELVIAEKPNAALRIAEALADGKPIKKKVGAVPYYELEHKGKKILVGCSVGHLYTLAEKDKKQWSYPVFDYEWKPTFEVDKHSKFAKVYFNVLRSLAKQADKYTVACDYDVEGSVIGMNIVRFICGKEDARRMKFSTLTKDELVYSYEHAMDHLDFPLAESGETRHKLDWLAGINLSRALTLSIKHSTGMHKILSTGRVQGPALKILYDREIEIKNFKAVPYWEIELIGEVKNGVVHAWHKSGKFWKRNDASGVLKKTETGKEKAFVSKVEKREILHKPPVPFDLTSLQVEAYAALGITPRQTLDIAQELYTNGLISYPRTSSQKLPSTINYKKILTLLKNGFSKECEFLLSKKALKPTEGKKTDPAHPAIYPCALSAEKLDKKCTDLYELIARRFFSVFGDDAVRESVVVEIDCGKEIFAARGMTTKEPGWYTLYGRFLRLKEEELPDVNEGEKVGIKEIKMYDKETQPPKRYTEASIVKELEKKNLGTKATRATVIGSLYDRGYIKEKSVEVTDLGIKTVETLEKYCPEILDEALTRKFEEEMELVREEKKNGENVVEEAKEFLAKALKQFEKHEKEIGKELSAAHIETKQKESYIGLCPVCGKGDLQIRRGKYGQFIACSKYPDCTTTFNLPKNGLIKGTEKLCEICGYPKMVVIIRGRRTQELCINPDCKSRKIDETLIEKLMVMKKKCPECGADLVVRKSISSIFWGCSKYPKCRHTESISDKETVQ